MPRRNTLFEMQPPQRVDEGRLAHVGHANHQDAVLRALEAKGTRAGSRWLSVTHSRSNQQSQEQNSPAVAGFSSSCASTLIPPAGGGGDLQMATLTPRTRTGSFTTTSHLSPVVPRAVAHQLGNQGNDLQRKTEKGCHGGSAPRLVAATHLEDAVPRGCAKWGPSRGWGALSKLEMKVTFDQPASPPHSGALRPLHGARRLAHGPQLPAAGLGMRLLAHYLFDVAIVLAVSEDDVRASLLLQVLQNCLKGTGRGIAGTCDPRAPRQLALPWCSPAAGEDQPGPSCSAPGRVGGCPVPPAAWGYGPTAGCEHR